MGRLGWILAALLGLALAALAVVAWQRETLAERALRGRLEALGVPVEALRVERIGAAGAKLRDLRLGDSGELRIDELDADYTPATLSAGRLSGLRIAGVDWKLAWGGDGLSLGSLDAARRGRGGGGGGAVDPPLDRARVEDARVHADTPFGPIEAQLSLEYADAGATLEADLAPFEIAREGRKPVAVPGLEITVRAVPEGSAWRFDLGVCHLEAGAVLHATGEHDLADGSGRARLRLDPILFEKGGLQPRHLHPLAGGWLGDAAGGAEASGALSWSNDSGLTGQIDLVFRDLDLTTPMVAVERINAVLHVDGPWPPRVPEGQLLSMQRLDFGLELADGVISYSLEPDGALHVERAEWKFAGGRVLTAGRIEPTGEQTLLLAVDDVDLARLFALVNLDGLSGEGRIGGRLPLRQREGRIEIRQAMLAGTREGGRIRYRPEAGVAGMAAAQPGLDQALAALEDFHWKELWLTLNGEARGELQIGLHIMGSNPEYHGGHPVEFNLNLEGHLVDLLRKASTVYTLPQAIEERIAELTGGKAAGLERALPIACRRQP